MKCLDGSLGAVVLTAKQSHTNGLDYYAVIIDDDGGFPKGKVRGSLERPLPAKLLGDDAGCTVEVGESPFFVDADFNPVPVTG